MKSVWNNFEWKNITKVVWMKVNLGVGEQGTMFNAEKLMLKVLVLLWKMAKFALIFGLQGSNLRYIFWIFWIKRFAVWVISEKVSKKNQVSMCFVVQNIQSTRQNIGNAVAVIPTTTKILVLASIREDCMDFCKFKIKSFGKCCDNSILYGEDLTIYSLLFESSYVHRET